MNVRVTIRPMTEFDVGPLLDTYQEVVAEGGAAPVGGAATEEVFREGWLNDRVVYVDSCRAR